MKTPVQYPASMVAEGELGCPDMPVIPMMDGQVDA